MEENPAPNGNDPKAKPGLGAGNDGKAKGWHSRGYLPHFDAPQTLQSVTFRLADALPKSKLQQLAAELENTDPEHLHAARRKRIEGWLDAGYGCCALAHPRVAQLMEETLLKWDGERYRMIAWCIMPNHVHVLMRTLAGLPKIIQSWKSYTGRRALDQNEDLDLGIPESTPRTFWMRDYWDRYIRDGNHFENVQSYIEHNPVKAGLCEKAADWRWSSASR